MNNLPSNLTGAVFEPNKWHETIKDIDEANILKHENVHNIIKALLLTRSSFFDKLAEQSNDRFIFIMFRKEQEEKLVWTNILALLKRTKVPKDEHLNFIPMMACPKVVCETLALDTTAPSWQHIDKVRDWVLEEHKKGNKHILVGYVAAEDSSSKMGGFFTFPIYSAIELSQLDGFETFQKYNPWLYDYFRSLSIEKLSQEDHIKTATEIINNTRCFVCKSSETKGICKDCCLARYCSTNCQKEDWPRHKHVCWLFALMKRDIEVMLTNL